jgi:hypothetical protein
MRDIRNRVRRLQWQLLEGVLGVFRVEKLDAGIVSLNDDFYIHFLPKSAEKKFLFYFVKFKYFSK